MFKYSIALILPLSFLTGFSIFSTENFTVRQYQLDAEREIAAASSRNEEPITPGNGRQETSTEKA